MLKKLFKVGVGSLLILALTGGVKAQEIPQRETVDFNKLSTYLGNYAASLASAQEYIATLQQTLGQTQLELKKVKQDLKEAQEKLAKYEGAEKPQ